MILISAVIDAYEDRDLVVFRIPGEYLNIDMEYDIFMIFCGTIAEVLVAYDPTIYCKYI